MPLQRGRGSAVIDAWCKGGTASAAPAWRALELLDRQHTAQADLDDSCKRWRLCVSRHYMQIAGHGGGEVAMERLARIQLGHASAQFGEVLLEHAHCRLRCS